jgi:hypothetical protein
MQSPTTTADDILPKVVEIFQEHSESEVLPHSLMMHVIDGDETADIEEALEDEFELEGGELHMAVKPDMTVQDVAETIAERL